MSGCEAHNEFFRTGVDRVGDGLDSGMGVVSIIGIEGRRPGRCMRGIVVRELCERKQLAPVVLRAVTEDMYVLFQDLINSFGLSITLGVIGCGSISFDIAEFKEVLGKLGNKLRTTVGHNILGEAVVLENMAEV